ETDLAGNTGPASAAMLPRLVIDTIRPTTPSVPSLLPADDSGTPGDNRTAVTMPHFTGTSEANAIIQIFARNRATGVNTLVGQGTASGTGAYNVQVSPTALVDGSYDITAVQIDLAGNPSVPSAPMTPPLVIDTTVGVPTLTMDPLSDTGAFNNDHIT